MSGNPTHLVLYLSKQTWLGEAGERLADEVRKALAIELLTKAGLKLDEIAGRLGYADAGSFIHAFKRWTGESPTQFRRQFWKD